MPHRRPAQPVVAFVGFGANLGDPPETFRGTLAALRARPGLLRVTASPVYRTVPVGEVAQDDFLNAVLRVETTLSALALLDVLLDVEQRFGRTREIHWGPRTLDLDLLLYGDRRIAHERLTVPHPEMHRRGFVLRPLSDLAPTAEHPVLRRSVVDLLGAWREGCPDPEGEVRPAAGDC